MIEEMNELNQSLPETSGEATHPTPEHTDMLPENPMSSSEAEVEIPSPSDIVDIVPEVEEKTFEEPIGHALEIEAPADSLLLDAPTSVEEDDEADTSIVAMDAEIAEEPIVPEEAPVFNALQEEEARQASIQAAVKEILNDASYFDHLNDHSLLELVFLVENLSQIDDLRPFLVKSGILKKTFESTYETERSKVFAVQEGSESLDPAEKEKQDSEREKHEKELKSLLSRFNTALAKFNKRKEEFERTIESEKLENSKLKESLLLELKVIVDQQDPTLIDKIKDIQQKWKAIGSVKADDMARLYNTFKIYLDNFYDLRGKYRELLEQDRKYNLVEKKKLIEEVRKLIPEITDQDREFWKEKSDELKRLHELWKTFGPVPEELSDSLWNEFRNVSDEFYAARNKYYEQQDALRAGNAEQKQAILNELAPYGTFDATTPNDWKEAMDKVIALQEAWRKTGPASQENNSLMWGQFKTASNSFFERKNLFFKKLEQDRKDNLAKKVALCEQADANKDSNDWKKATDLFKRLQEEWKKVGPVPEKDTQRIWKRFRNSCDEYFKRKEHHFAALAHDFDENLQKKINLCERAEALIIAEDRLHRIQEAKDLQAEWNSVGQVPLKEKDKIWNRFRTAMDSYFNGLGADKSEVAQIRTRMKYEQMATTPSNDDRNNPLKFEERKLRDRIKELDGQIEQYENNILFISRGKAGDSLREEIRKKIDLVKKDKGVLMEKLKVLKSVKEGQ